MSCTFLLIALLGGFVLIFLWWNFLELLSTLWQRQKGMTTAWLWIYFFHFRQLAANISVAFGNTTSSTFSLKPVPYFKELLSVFKDIKSSVDVEQDTVATHEMEEYSFQVCLKKETQSYVALLDLIVSQLEEVVLGLEGDISFTSNMHEVAKVISKGMVPQAWCRHSNISLAKWVCSLKQKISAIDSYRQYEVNAPLTIDIGAFLNKSLLFHALMSDWSRVTGILLHKMEITSEVCIIIPWFLEINPWIFGNCFNYPFEVAANSN